MDKYYVNKNAQKNGDHEVHKEGCIWMPTIYNRISVGNWSKCSSAVIFSKLYFVQSNGCAYCCRECHTS